MAEPAPSGMVIGHWKKAPFTRRAVTATIRHRGPGRFGQGGGTLDRCSFFVHSVGMSNAAFPQQMPSQHSSPGQLLARGVCRCLMEHGFACLPEVVPRPGLRVDVMALGRKGEIWVVECKSSRADFTADHKWQGYLAYADRFFWAVDTAFPLALLPAESGVILADRFGGEILRMGPETKLPSARRRVLTQGFARTAAWRLAGQAAPERGLSAFL